MSEHDDQGDQGGDLDGESGWRDHVHSLIGHLVADRATSDAIADVIGADLDGRGDLDDEGGRSTVVTKVAVPDGSVVVSAIEVACWLDDGGQQYGIRIGGEETYVHCHGMLAYAGHFLHEMHMGRTTGR